MSVTGPEQLKTLVWYNIEGSCPVCGQRLRLREVGGGFALGQDSDLLVRMKGPHVVQAAIHSCLRCRYSGYAADFALTLSRAQVERYLAEVSPKLGGAPGGALAATPLPDVQYHWAYKCAAFLARDDGELGERLLRAYWCLRLPPSADLPSAEAAERRSLYLAGAIHHLRQDSRAKRDAVRLYVLAELHRKCGDFAAAVGYFKRFLETASEKHSGSPAYLRLAAAKLLQAAERADSRDRTMEEIVYAES